MTTQERSARMGMIGGIAGCLIGGVGGLMGAYYGGIKVCEDPQKRMVLTVATVVGAIAYVVAVALFFLFIGRVARLRNTMLEKIQRGEVPPKKTNTPKDRAFVIKAVLATFVAWLVLSVAAIVLYRPETMTAGQWGGLIGGLGGGLGGVCGGVIGTYYGITRTNGPTERRFMIWQAIIAWIVITIYLAILGLGYYFFRPYYQWIIGVCQPLFICSLFPWIMWCNARQRVIAAEEAKPKP